MDTFFTIYFIVVGVLFTLNLISVLIKFFTADGEDWQFQLAEDVLNWCLMLYPIRKRNHFLLWLRVNLILRGNIVSTTIQSLFTEITMSYVEN